LLEVPQPARDLLFADVPDELARWAVERLRLQSAKAFEEPQTADLAEVICEAPRSCVPRGSPAGRGEVSRATRAGRRGYAPPCSLTTRRAEAKSMPMLTDLGHTTTATTSSSWSSRMNRCVRLLLLTRTSWK
jgi:hypothetical protein